MTRERKAMPKRSQTLGYVADRTHQPEDQWWYDADEEGALLWKVRTPQGKRWRRRGPNGETLYKIKDHYKTEEIGPYRFVEHLTGHVILLAGETDVEVAHQYGSSGGYNFGCMPISETSAKGLLDPMDQATQITVLYDADPAGRKGCKTVAQRIQAHRQERGLPPISVSYFAGEGNSGEDLKDVAMSVPEFDRKAAVIKWIQDGIHRSVQALPPPPPDPADTDGLYPLRPTHDAVADWMLRVVGAEWDGSMWKDSQILHVNGYSEKDPGQWVGFQGGRWREIDFTRISASFIKQACFEIQEDISILRDRLRNGFRGSPLADDDAKRVDAKVDHLKSTGKFLESHHAQDFGLRIVKKHVARNPDCFDHRDVVAGEVPDLGDPSDCVIRNRVDIGRSHPAMIFDITTGKVREAQKEDMVTRGLSVALPEDTSVPSDVTVEGLAAQNTAAESWVMTYCPNIWDFMLQMSTYYPDPETPEGMTVDLEMAALLVETAGLCMIGTMQPFFTIMTGERGRNGKGIYAGIIKEITKDIHYAAKELLERQQASGHTERIARTVGKHFIHVDEPDPRIDVERLKHLTGGSEIEASFKGGGQFRFCFNGHILITTNEEIYLGAPTNSVLDRMTVIPCQAIFDGEKAMYPKRHPSKIYESVRVEYAHFALLALTLARRATRTMTRAKCDRADDAAMKMLSSVNPVGQWLSERVEIGADYSELQEDLYDNYKAWCKDLKRRPRTYQAFMKDLRQITDALNLAVTVGHRPWRASGVRPRLAKGLKLNPVRSGL